MANIGGVKGLPRLFLENILEAYNENNRLGKKR